MGGGAGGLSGRAPYPLPADPSAEGLGHAVASLSSLSRTPEHPGCSSRQPRPDFWKVAHLARRHGVYALRPHCGAGHIVCLIPLMRSRRCWLKLRPPGAGEGGRRRLPGVPELRRGGAGVQTPWEGLQSACFVRSLCARQH